MRHQHWFKVWQDRLLSDPNWREMPLSIQGFVFNCWLLAARAARGGSTELTPKSIKNHLRIHGNSFANHLRIASESGWIQVNISTGFVVVPRWAENQESESASRVRKHRAGKRECYNPVTSALPTRTRAAEAEVEVDADKERREKESPDLNFLVSQFEAVAKWRGSPRPVYEQFKPIMEEHPDAGGLISQMIAEEVTEGMKPWTFADKILERVEQEAIHARVIAKEKARRRKRDGKS